MALLVLVAGACGDDGGAVPTRSSGAQTTISTPDDANPSTAALHPTLAALPLPPGYEVPFPADEYGADIDERETVVQFIIVKLPSDEVARFLLAELPGAGFTVVERSGSWIAAGDVMADVEGVIYVTTPDNLPAQLVLKPQGAQTGINVNLYRAGAFP